MTKEEAIKELKELTYKEHPDPEEDHEKADNILCHLLIELGYIEVIEVYNRIIKWYS